MARAAGTEWESRWPALFAGTWIARFRSDDGRQHYDLLGAADDARDPDGLSVFRYLSDDEARRLTNACPPDFCALVVSAQLTGCRYGELAAMVIDDFSSDAGPARVRASKSGKPRHAVLTQEGRDFIAQRAAGTPGSARLFLRGNGEALGQIRAAAPGQHSHGRKTLLAPVAVPHRRDSAPSLRLARSGRAV